MLEIPAVNQNVFIDDVTYLFHNNTVLCNLILMPTLMMQTYCYCCLLYCCNTELYVRFKSNAFIVNG